MKLEQYIKHDILGIRELDAIGYMDIKVFNEHYMGVMIHGSEDSLDRDAYMVYNKSIGDITEKWAKKVCEFGAKTMKLNANVIVIDDGKVIWCYKGTLDEVNNGILRTYSLHDQLMECPVTETVERDLYIKVIRVMRCLLSYCSRQMYWRTRIKQVQRTGNLQERLDMIDQIDYNSIKDYVKSPLLEVHKTFAFQLGQVFSLMCGKELYTKSEVAKEYPELRPYLYREGADPSVLVEHIKCFTTLVRRLNFPSNLSIVKERYLDEL